MTITLPFPVPAGDAFADNDGGNALNSPPVGAPEGNAPETVNDIQRRDKTAIKQNVENIDAINQALGTMAEQDASSVAITGGTIDAAVSVALAVNSTQFGGLTLQALYDLTYPVNEAIVIRNIETSPPTWPGTSSTWTLTAQGLFLKPIVTGQTVGETFSGVSETDPTVLTEAELPAHRHQLFASDTVGVGAQPAANESVATVLTVGSNDNYVIARSDPTSLEPNSGRSSEVGSGAGHTHTFDDNPPFQRVAAYLRTA